MTRNTALRNTPHILCCLESLIFLQRAMLHVASTNLRAPRQEYFGLHRPACERSHQKHITVGREGQVSALQDHASTVAVACAKQKLPFNPNSGISQPQLQGSHDGTRFPRATLPCAHVETLLALWLPHLMVS